MTPSIETDRFNAKCASGKTYTVIEKTKEINEPTFHNKQVFVTIQKSYSLSTGEEVNKLADKHYLIIREQIIISRKNPFFSLKIPTLRKSLIADIKTIFDYLKNQALCIAIILAIPEIQKVLAKVHSGSSLRILATSTATSMAIVFSAYNLIWFYSSLEEKPKLKSLHVFAMVFTFALVAVAIAMATLKTYQESTN